MNTPSEREQIVADLTPAQRAKLLEIGNGQPREYALGGAGFALLRKNLVFVNELGARHLTDEGHAIRDHLKESN
jgi:hypothetical protein